MANVNYNLLSIVVHKGQARAGHYEAYARDDQQVLCHYIDAATPVRVDEQVVLGQCAYLVFYERDS